MKKLVDILESLVLLEGLPSEADSVSEISLDSRSCKHGSLFIAYKGNMIDSHEYIESAVSNGAQFIVLEDASYMHKHDVKYFLVKDIRKAISRIAANYYGHPSSELTVVGVTGTNGKTTTSELLYELLFRLGYKCGLISTIRVAFGETKQPSKLTTPDAISLHRLFRDMRDNGVGYVFMEVSSHAIDQGRVCDVDFDHVIFTNLTHDHLDYHGTFAEYRDTKKRLFDSLGFDKTALTNVDDSNGKYMVQNCQAEVNTYALKKPADFKAKVISNEVSGLQLNIDGHEVFLRMVGEYNGYNALAAYATCKILGLEDDVLTALSTLVPAEGRMEIVRAESVAYTVIVDYAHTPDALEKILSTLSSMKTSESRIITVVGCGGDRDKAKRPKMARVAERFSDVLLITSDNPRSEDPQDIIDEMIEGIEKEDRKKVLTIVDRKQAIQMACTMALANDIILIAGKGHEKYQDINGVKTPFDDKKVALDYMS